MNKSPVSRGPLLSQAAWRPCTERDIAIAYIEGIVVYSSAARDYIPAAVPSGAAQEARYPLAAGDIPSQPGPGRAGPAAASFSP